MKNYIVSLIILVSVFSCEVQKNKQNSMFGVYKMQNRGSAGKITLNKDSTFIYEYNAGLINTKSIGTWVQKSESIVLSSYEEFLTNQIKVVEKNESNNLRVVIVDSERNPIEGAFVVFNMDDKTAVQTDYKGEVELKDNKVIKIFEIHYLGEIYKYEVIDSNSDFFDVVVYLDDLNKTYFDKKQFKIKNRILNINGLKFIKE